MKVYLFDTQTGLYEGDSFEEPDMLKYEEGITTVPSPDYQQGQIPVFDKTRQVWEVIPISVARQLLKIHNHIEQEKSHEQL